MSNEDLDKNIIAGHDYDGIHELDNPLPRWWLVTFYLTIIFSVVYYWYYTTTGITLADDLEKDMAVITEQQSQVGSTKVEVESGQLAAILGDSQAMEAGKTHYMSKCAACHGQEGQGLIGPNFVDKFWVYGKGEFSAVVNVIRDGTAKGMPPWKGAIPDNEILSVAAYIISLEGNEVANPRAPEGEEVTE